MPYRKGSFAEGEYYHIYNRGTQRGKIFYNPGNYIYCVKLIKKYSQQYNITVITYCLMPNHYHMVLRQDASHSVSKFIGTVFNAYTQALNRERNRMGILFEGRFKHAHLPLAEDILHVCRYLHLNPVNAGLVEKPEDWAYSNYREWLGYRDGTLKDDAWIQAYFPQRMDYQKFVMDYYQEVDAQKKIARYIWDECTTCEPPGGLEPPGGN